MASGRVRTVSVRVTAEVSDLDKKLASVQKSLKKVGKQVQEAGKGMTKWVTGPIVAVGGGLAALAIKTGNTADRILDLNAITGMSTDSIQEWQNVTKIAGVEVESVTEASKQLTKQMSTMRDGTGKQAEALAELGIEFADLEAASPDERMNILTQALANVADPAKQAELGTDLLRGAWDGLAPVVALGAEEISNAQQAAHDMGGVMGEDALNNANEFRIGMENLKTEFMAAGQGIMSDFMPILTDQLLPFIQDTIVPLMRDFAEKIQSVFEWFGNLSPEMQRNIGIGIALAAAMGPIVLIVGKIITIISTLIPIVKGLSTALMFLSANPVGLVIVGIAALVAAGVLLWKNWDTVKEKAKSIWDSIVGVIRGPVNMILGFANSIIGAYEKMLNSVAKVINAIPSINIPEWVPKFGGMTFGIPNIPQISLPKIPMLETGTNFVPKDMLAMLHKGEAVVPKEFNPSAGGDQMIHTTINIDGRKVAQATSRPQNDLLDRRKFGQGVPT